jgi:hypothetical protein
MHLAWLKMILKLFQKFESMKILKVKFLPLLKNKKAQILLKKKMKVKKILRTCLNNAKKETLLFEEAVTIGSFVEPSITTSLKTLCGGVKKTICLQLGKLNSIMTSSS